VSENDMRGRRRRVKAGCIEDFRGADVELRVLGGAIYRGRLDCVTKDALILLRANGRAVLVSRASLVAISDESRPLQEDE